MGLLDWLWRGLTETERRPTIRTSQRSQRSQKSTVRPPRGEDDLEQLARRLERGEVRGEELRELMRTGKVRVRRRNPEEALERARRLARLFHGTDKGHVIELDSDERKAPRYGVVVGEVEAIEYRPLGGSRRAGAVYRHESGDRGEGKRSPYRPLLVVDPETRRPHIVPHRSPVRFSAKRGLVG